MSNSLESYDSLSIVLQGPTELGSLQTARAAARSARKSFPGAEIIVSCWDGNTTKSVRPYVDLVISSADPGPQRFGGGVLNVNRQIVSSRAGAEVATRPYVLKARSDLVFRNANVWSEFLRHKSDFEAKFDRDPILITNLTSINPNRYPRYFALCDWIYLGRAESVRELLAAPLFPDAHLDHNVNGQANTLYNAEQWIVMNYLVRHGLDVSVFPNGHDQNPDIARAHEDFVGRHFALSSWFRLGMKTQKHRISSFSLDRMYTHREWAEAFSRQRRGLDLERLAISVLYHPTVRRLARRILRNE